MATGEDQPQLIIRHRRGLLHVLTPRGQECGLRLPVAAGRLAPQVVDAAAAGSGDDPTGGSLRQPRHRPFFSSEHKGVLDSLLGEVQIAEGTSEYGDRTAVLRAEDR